MKFQINPDSSKQLQRLFWGAVLFMFFVGMLPQEGLVSSITFTFLNVSFYAIVIYVNIGFLFPKIYEKGHKIWYAICAFIFTAGFSILRCYFVVALDNKYFVTVPEKADFPNIANFVIAGFLVYLLSFVFQMALAYFSLKQQSEKIMAQKSEAELNLLKSHVQPHFLFNTLNNIYYETYLDAPRGANLIARLAEIMRYFVDESPKNKVDIRTEINFLENYIALEKIRVKYPIALCFKKEYEADIQIPPMLLMTFVENVFKHGIDKLNKENNIEMSLIQENGYLLFRTKNHVHDNTTVEEGGFGIKNLRKRLNLLYAANFELNINYDNEYFTAFLKVPVS
jgi:hypothetical protein